MRNRYLVKKYHRNKEKSNNVGEKFLVFLKEYYYILGTIPLIVGGLFQYFNLKELGLNYTRFISVTQLLIDGLLVLFVGGSVALLLGVLIFFFMFALKGKKFKLYLATLFIILPFTIYYGVDAISDFNNSKRTDNYLPAIAFSLMLFFTLISYKWRSSITIKKVYYFFLFVSWLLVTKHVFLYGVQLSNQAFSSNINEDVIECTLKNDYTDYEKHNVSYFNDKYLFINLTRDGIERTVVYPHSTFFNFDCLNNN